jgi:hypothetical protein
MAKLLTPAVPGRQIEQEARPKQPVNPAGRNRPTHPVDPRVEECSRFLKEATRLCRYPCRLHGARPAMIMRESAMGYR